VDETAVKLGISHGSVLTIIHSKLQMRKVCAKWLPRELTTKHKKIRVEVCTRLLERCQKEGEAVLKRVVTGDETWVHRFGRESKRQSMHWKHRSSSTTKFKAESSAGKVMLMLFWYIARRKVKVSNDCYCAFLTDEQAGHLQEVKTPIVAGRNLTLRQCQSAYG
jgi:histone-lysine N-methyltransferase SETMAR